MATQLDPTTFGYQNFYSALLTGDITSATLVIGLDTVPSPTSGILVIDPDSTTAREVILYTSKGASTITCPSDGRGWDSTTAAAHLTGTTVIMADVDEYFRKIASGELSTDPLRTTLFFDHIASGGAVAQSAGLVGTFSNIIFYINGVKYTGSSIANKTYTASKDTYVDITGASGGAVTVLYTEVANNAASPALTTNYIRVAIVTTSGAAITNSNQGQENQVIPIASSVAYSVTDSLGNLIYPRDPNRRILGHRQQLAPFVTASQTAGTAVTGISCPVIVPTGRKVRVSISADFMTQNGAAGTGTFLGIYEGATELKRQTVSSPGTTYATPATTWTEFTPTAGSHTYLGAFWVAGNTGTLNTSATSPIELTVELV